MQSLFPFLALLFSFSFTAICIPPVVRVSRQKNLFDSFNDRKIHKTAIPPLGGVAIFIGFVLSTILTTDQYSLHQEKYIMAAVIILFFIGLKDDLLDISAKKKFAVQLFAALLIVFAGNIRFSNFHGILGIHEIPYIVSTSFSLFFILLTVNAYNLIDGIDGLASGLVIIASGILGSW